MISSTNGQQYDCAFPTVAVRVYVVRPEQSRSSTCALSAGSGELTPSAARAGCPESSGKKLKLRKNQSQIVTCTADHCVQRVAQCAFERVAANAPVHIM